MTTSEVNKIFDTFEKMRVIVVGDTMLDAYLYGNAERISPEAPVPVVSVAEHENRLGGAANVALNLKKLGATPYLFSVNGNDDNGEVLKTLLKQNGISGSGIFTDNNRKTTVKTRIISKGRQVMRFDEESVEPIDSDLETRLADAVVKLINEQQIDLIIFVDYDKGVITETLFETINGIALQNNIPTAVDPKKRNFHIYNNVTLFKPNFKEFAEGTDIKTGKEDINSLNAVAGNYKQQHNFKLIFITLSESGVFVSNGTANRYYPAVKRLITDVSGAGDTVISVAGLAMAAGLSPETMALMSNLAGGLVCEEPGVVPVSKTRLKKEMEQHDI